MDKKNVLKSRGILKSVERSGRQWGNVKKWEIYGGRELGCPAWLYKWRKYPNRLQNQQCRWFVMAT